MSRIQNPRQNQSQRKQTAQEHPPVPSIDTQDRVDEASYDSFPASDPPSHAGSRSQPRDTHRGPGSERH